jgi:hypothetical protein
VDRNGFVRQLNDSNYIEQTTLPDNGVFWQVDFDYPAREVDGEYHFPTLMQMSAEPVYNFIDLPSGWYSIQEQTVARSDSPPPLVL